MLNKGGKEISIIYVTGKAISMVRKGGRLAWEAINSCFGKGRWVNLKPWINKDGWKNQ